MLLHSICHISVIFIKLNIFFIFVFLDMVSIFCQVSVTIKNFIFLFTYYGETKKCSDVIRSIWREIDNILVFENDYFEFYYGDGIGSVVKTLKPSKMA